MTSYHSYFDANGRICAQFDRPNGELHFDFVRELDAKCRAKYPEAELVGIRRQRLFNASGVFGYRWTVTWLRPENTEKEPAL